MLRTPLRAGSPAIVIVGIRIDVASGSLVVLESIGAYVLTETDFLI